MHHALDVFLRTTQPILQRQKVGSQVLGCARNEAQHLRDAAQHLHLFGTGGGFFAVVFGVAAHFFQESHRSAGGLGHVEFAQAGEFDHFARRHGAHHGAAVVAPRLQIGQDRQEVVFHEQHGHNNDVALGDVFAATCQVFWTGGKFRGRMDGQAQVGQQTFQADTCAVHRTVEVGIHGDNHHAGADVLLCALLEWKRHAVCS